MIYPSFLPKNGTIGICAPSYGIAIEPYISRYRNAKKNFLNLGYNIKETPHLFDCFVSGKTRAEEFVDMWKDPSVDILFSAAGGEFMMEILAHIDFLELKKYRPKYFIGYSDNTHLTLLLTTHLDIATIYGQCFPPFGMSLWDQSISDMYDLITGNKTVFNSYPKFEINPLHYEVYLSPFNNTEKTIWNTLNIDSNIQGRIVGGCLDVILMHLGTKYDLMKEFMFKYQDVILFLESYDLSNPALKRALWQLKECEWFTNCQAVIFGRSLRSDLETIKIYQELLMPVIYDVDIGHVPPTIPIVNGALVKISVYNNHGTLEYIFR